MACQFTTGSSWCYTLTKDIDQVTACFYYQCNLDLWFLTAVQEEIMEMMTTVPIKQQWRKACSKLKSKNIPDTISKHVAGICKLLI